MTENHYESYSYSNSSAYTNINGKEEGKSYTTERIDKDGKVQEVKVEEHLKPNGEVEVKEVTSDGKTNQYTLPAEDKPKELKEWSMIRR